jgi:hypothetical protein
MIRNEQKKEKPTKMGKYFNICNDYNTLLRSKDFSSAAISREVATERRRESSNINVGCCSIAGEW